MKKETNSRTFFLNLAECIKNMKGLTVPVGSKVMQRGIADILEKHVCDLIKDTYKDTPGVLTKDAKSKRSIEDVLIETEDQNVFVDVKTGDTKGTFSMPNLISVERLRQLYKDPKNIVIYVFVSYEKIDDQTVMITDIVQAAPEEIHPSCLQVQNLGRGQLQIKKGMAPVIDKSSTRAAWLQSLKGLVVDFHRRQLIKTQRDLDSWLTE